MRGRRSSFNWYEATARVESDRPGAIQRWSGAGPGPTSFNNLPSRAKATDETLFSGKAGFHCLLFVPVLKYQAMNLFSKAVCFGLMLAAANRLAC